MEKYPIGWEILIDLEEKIFFILGQSRDALNVSQIAEKINQKGHRIQDETPLLKTFPEIQDVITHFENKGYKYCKESYQAHYNVF